MLSKAPFPPVSQRKEPLRTLFRDSPRNQKTGPSMLILSSLISRVVLYLLPVATVKSTTSHSSRFSTQRRPGLTVSINARESGWMSRENSCRVPKLPGGWVNCMLCHKLQHQLWQTCERMHWQPPRRSQPPDQRSQTLLIFQCLGRQSPRCPPPLCPLRRLPLGQHLAAREDSRLKASLPLMEIETLVLL